VTLTLGAMAWWLLVAHFVFDYPLQGDTTAREKNPNSTTDLQRFVPWYYWMAAHALQHGAAVAFVTGSIVLGIGETVAHFFIDLAKCEGRFTIHVDQALHLYCKGCWVVAMWSVR
jgi:hypothetical protein